MKPIKFFIQLAETASYDPQVKDLIDAQSNIMKKAFANNDMSLIKAMFTKKKSRVAADFAFVVRSKHIAK